MSHIAHIIAVACDVPPMPLMAPPGDCRAMLLMARLLAKTLKAVGLDVESVGAIGEFNFAAYLFYISDAGREARNRALEALRDELAAIGLLRFSAIGWFDPDEAVWRDCYPRPGGAVIAAKISDDLMARRKLASDGWIQEWNEFAATLARE